MSEGFQELDLGAGGEAKIYLTDPKMLKSKTDLDDPNGLFNIMGEYEYCDIFGRYYCESFGAQYKPAPIDDFIGGMRLPCVIEPSVNARYYEQRGYKEIQPCEQPDELGYIRLPANLRPTVAASPRPTAKRK